MLIVRFVRLDQKEIKTPISPIHDRKLDVYVSYGDLIDTNDSGADFEVLSMPEPATGPWD